jgi:hypothetical protein
MGWASRTIAHSASNTGMASFRADVPGGAVRLAKRLVVVYVGVINARIGS